MSGEEPSERARNQESETYQHLSLLTFPDEILVAIVSSLDCLSDLRAVSLVCLRLREIARERIADIVSTRLSWNVIVCPRLSNGPDVWAFFGNHERDKLHPAWKVFSGRGGETARLIHQSLSQGTRIALEESMRTPFLSASGTCPNTADIFIDWKDYSRYHKDYCRSLNNERKRRREEQTCHVHERRPNYRGFRKRALGRVRICERTGLTRAESRTVLAF